MAKANPKATAYEKHKGRTAALQRKKSAAGRDIGSIPDIVDIARREACRFCFRTYLETYHAHLFFRPFSKLHYDLIGAIQYAILVGRMKALAVFRSFGKSTIMEFGTLWATKYGHWRYALLIAATADIAVQNLDNILMPLLHNDLLLEDFPEICFPLRALEGTPQKAAGQLCEGKQTHVKVKKDSIRFPWLPDLDVPSNGGYIHTIGVGGAMRGMNITLPSGERVRPDGALCDDVQTRESAMSARKSDVVEMTLDRDMAYLCDAAESLSALLACTIVAQGDVADRVTDRTKHPEWAGERHKMLITLPENEALWEQYSDMWRAELADSASHDVSMALYVENRVAMDLGGEASWKELFNRKDEISAIQHGMNLKAKNEGAFWSEAQNMPPSDEGVSTGLLTADEIAGQLSMHKRGLIPAETTHITGYIDVHDDLLYWVVCAWQDDFTGFVVDYGTLPKQKGRHFVKRTARTTMKTEYSGGEEAQVRQGLNAAADLLLGREWAGHGDTAYLIDLCIVDGGWRADLVREFCRSSEYGTKLMVSFGKGIGAGKKPFDEYVKKKGVKTGLHWRQPKPQPGHRRHTTIDTNYWKTFVHMRFATTPGTTGSLTLYGKRADMHAQFSDHMVAEYRVQTEGRDRRVDEWFPRADHRDNHWFDCIVGCAVGASILGVHLAGTSKASKPGKRKRIRYSDAKRNR